MGKLKKAKKFRQRHLKDKVKQRSAERKYAKLVGNRKAKPGRQEADSEEFRGDSNGRASESLGVPAGGVSFSAPPENFALESFISDSENEGATGSGSDNDDSDANGDTIRDLIDEEAEVEVLSDELSDHGDSAELSVTQVKAWVEALGRSPKNIKQIIRALRAEGTTDPSLATAIVDAALVSVPAALRRHLPDPRAKRVAKDFGPTLKAYCTELSRLLSDTAGNPRVVAAVETAAPYFRALGLRKNLKELVKALVGVIASPDIDNVSDTARMGSFGVLRSLDESELAQKYGYEALVKLAGRTTPHTLPVIHLTKNLVATLYGGNGAYAMAFKQLRTLALHLKTALDSTKNPGYDLKVVYTWSYVHMLDFWSRAISLNSELRGLVHPLVQVTLRTATLVPTAQYLPLRFQLVRSLVRLSRHTGVYIPLVPIVLEALNMAALTHRGKKASLRQLDWDSVLHVPQSYVGTRVFQVAAADELVDILTEVLVLWAKSIAFPELATPVIISVRRASKKLEQNPSLAKHLNTWTERVQSNSDFVLRKRQGVSFGPRDTAQVAAFLENTPWEQTPLGQMAETRARVRKERQAMALAARGGSDSDDNANADLGVEDE